MLSKQTILRINKVYTAHAFQTEYGFYVGAGSETDPTVHLYDLRKGKFEEVADCPGGMMSFIPVPGRPDSFVSIMGLFPPFIGGEAGLYLHQKADGEWKTEKAMALPFAHRCEFIRLGGRNYLVAASVSQFKENPADWTRPGELHLISMDSAYSLPWNSTVMKLGITRNHGMIKTTLDAEELLFVSGQEGVYSIGPGPDQHWEVKTLFEKEVSEVVFIDLDGDGQSEMITIEPFHGSTINVYKRVSGEWELIFSDSLSFGHGLNCGIVNGKPVFVVGNRSESLALELFGMEKRSGGKFFRKIIEEEVGPTQTQVFRFDGRDYILSANQKKNEVALYSGSLD